MKKYWFLLKASLSTTLEYRGALLIWILVQLVSLASSTFIWLAIFRTNNNVGGYNFSGIISYYLVLLVVDSLTTIYVSEHLPRMIKDGQISTDLMKPYSIAFAQLLNQFSFKITQMAMKIPIFIIVGLVFISVFNLKFNGLYLLLSLFVCVFSYILHFSIDILISYFAFWFDDVWSLSHLKSIVLMILGGLAFPLDLLPKDLQTIFNFLPFHLIYYFPVKVAQGAVSTPMFINQFSQLILWILAFLFLGNILWRLGLKKYGAYGN